MLTHRHALVSLLVSDVLGIIHVDCSRRRMAACAWTKVRRPVQSVTTRSTILVDRGRSRPMLLAISGDRHVSTSIMIRAVRSKSRPVPSQTRRTAYT